MSTNIYDLSEDSYMFAYRLWRAFVTGDTSKERFEAWCCALDVQFDRYGNVIE